MIAPGGSNGSTSLFQNFAQPCFFVHNTAHNLLADGTGKAFGVYGGGACFKAIVMHNIFSDIVGVAGSRAIDNRSGLIPCLAENDYYGNTDDAYADPADATNLETDKVSADPNFDAALESCNLEVVQGLKINLN